MAIKKIVNKMSNRNGRLKVAEIFCAAGLGFALAGCGGQTQTAENPTAADVGGITVAKKLLGARSTFVYPIMTKWADAYKQSKNVEVNYQSIGSGAGIKQLTSRCKQWFS